MYNRRNIGHVQEKGYLCHKLNNSTFMIIDNQSLKQNVIVIPKEKKQN